MAVAGGGLAAAGLLGAAPAQALTSGQITPIVQILDGPPNLNTNPVDQDCIDSGIDPSVCPPNLGLGLTDPGEYTYGYGFDVSAPFTANALGVFHPATIPDYSYLATHVVSLFRFTGSDYATEGGNPGSWTSVVTATQEGSPTGVACSGVVKDLFCWLAITPTQIAIGKYRVSATGGWDVDYFADGGNVLNAIPEVTWTDGVFAELPSTNDVPINCYTYPRNSTNCTADRYPLWAANVSAVVPGPLPLLGAAAGFGWTRRLRRRVALQATLSPRA
jgi:hypothetical protein